MKILVTGGAGFIGSHLVDALVKDGHAVAVVDDFSTGSRKNINTLAKFHEADISDANKLADIFAKEKPEIVFHYAAQMSIRDSVKDPAADAKTNIIGSINILEQCVAFGVKKIIFSSSGGSIYGDATVFPTPETAREHPLSPYAIAKFSVEQYVRYYQNTFSLPFTILRFGNVYGPRQNAHGEAGVVAIFIEKMLAGEQPFINGTGKQTRDFVFVDDVISASLAALKSEQGGIFNVGTGIETDIDTIFSLLNELTDAGCVIQHREAAKAESLRSSLDITAIERAFHWQPKRGLQEGLRETVAWFSQR
jgi:UDP-glucose 4-epimerase